MDFSLYISNRDSVFYLPDMDSLTLEKQLHDVQNFVGVFPFDLLPKKPSGDFSLIVNTDNSTQPGDHWLVLSRKDSKMYFIDSFGRNYNDLTFDIDFVKSMRNFIGDEQVRYNQRWLQRLTSNVCGVYCIYFVRELTKHSLSYCLSAFNENLRKNDQYVLNYLNGI